MPYKKNYNRSTVGTGDSRTPSSVMGSQGGSAKIPTSHFQNKSTKHTPHRANNRSHGAHTGGAHNQTNHQLYM